MKVRYEGPNIGIDGLFNGNIYTVVKVDELTGLLSIIDESGEDYIYSPIRPGPAAGKYRGGKFIVVEDDENGTLSAAING